MPNISLSYYGYFTPFGGYGIANLHWIEHLSNNGIDVFPHPKFTYDKNSPEWNEYTDIQKELLSRPFEKQRVGIIESTPFDFDVNESDVRIANTMCETSRISGSWVQKCNSMDYIVVPNEWNKKVFIDSGIVVPIFVIPHGVDTEFWTKQEKKKEKNVFTFGIVGYLNDRKGVFDVIQAFASEFEKDEPVELVLKTSNPAFGFYSQFSDSRIKTISGNISRNDLRDLYSDFDAFVFPSKAEGVGYPPREAMAMGIPTIVGNYSGLHDVADELFCYPLNPIELVEGVNPQNIEQPGAWANYDVQEIMGFMREVYENREKSSKKGEKAAQFIRDNFSWDICAKKMVGLLEEII